MLLAAVLALCSSVVAALPIGGSIDVRAITVRPAGSSPQSDIRIGQDIQYADAIYDQIGLGIRLSSSAFLARDSNNAGNPGQWTSNEFRNNAFLSLAPPRAAGNEIHVYYVQDLAGARGFTVSQEDNAANPGIILRSERGTATLAHELGHMLLDEWRWRAQEQFGPGGFHSQFGNDLMADGSVIIHPVTLDNVFPRGAPAEIRPTIGTLNNSGVPTSDTIFQTDAMYFQNSFVQGLVQDTIAISLEDFDTPFFGWGRQQSFANIVVNEAARKVSKHKEEVTFHFRRLGGFGAGSGGDDHIFDIALHDLQSIDSAYDSVDMTSLVLRTGDDILANPAAIATLASGTDYAGALSFDDPTNAAGFVLRINEAALLGKRDVFVTFSLNTVPAPSVLLLLAFGGALMWPMRREKQRPTSVKEKGMTSRG